MNREREDRGRWRQIMADLGGTTGPRYRLDTTDPRTDRVNTLTRHYIEPHCMEPTGWVVIVAL